MSGGGERKVAVIVALDAVGYSRQSEIDEKRTIAAVSALRERIEAGASAHGGRLFNCAGDGFMPEFGSASGALAFAEELLSSSRAPLRAGAHVGDVTAMPNGDLLGRGVNVASRLQAMAATGELLAPEDLKHARPGFGSRICMLVLASVGPLNEAFAIADLRYADLSGATPSARERRWLETVSSAHDTSPLF